MVCLFKYFMKPFTHPEKNCNTSIKYTHNHAKKLFTYINYIFIFTVARKIQTTFKTNTSCNESR